VGRREEEEKEKEVRRERGREAGTVEKGREIGRNGNSYFRLWIISIGMPDGYLCIYDSF